MNNKNLLYTKPAKTEYILYPKVNEINLLGWHIYMISYPARTQNPRYHYNSEKGRKSTALLSSILLHDESACQPTLPCDLAYCSSSLVLSKECSTW